MVAIRRRYHSPPPPLLPVRKGVIFHHSGESQELQFPGTEERSEGPPQSVRAHTKLATFTAITLNLAEGELAAVVLRCARAENRRLSGGGH